MKKFLSMMLAVLMLLSMATVALADEEQQPASGTWNMTGLAVNGTFNLKLEYTNIGTWVPDETFNFTITPQNTGDPTPTVTTRPSISAGVLSDTITVTLPGYTKVGTYKYTMTQTAGSTKGVTYDTVARTLVVWVENNGQGGFKCQVALYKGTEILANKNDTFTNVYNNGTLDVSKTVVTTVDADKTNDYQFTVELTDLNADATYSYTKGQTTTAITVEDAGNSTFIVTLKNGESFSLPHLPVGATYTVTEQNAIPNASHNGKWKVSAGLTKDENDAWHTAGTIAAGSNSVAVTNEFDYTGTLTIAKVVAGNSGDMVNDEFTFTLNIDKSFYCSDIGGKMNSTDDSSVYTIKLKHGESVTLTDIPYGAMYTVTENTADTYTMQQTFAEYLKDADEADGTTLDGVIDHAKEVVTFTNTRETEIPTGVSLDSLPYVLMLALAGAGLVLMIARKRRVED